MRAREAAVPDPRRPAVGRRSVDGLARGAAGRLARRQVDPAHRDLPRRGDDGRGARAGGAARRPFAAPADAQRGSGDLAGRGHARHEGCAAGAGELSLAADRGQSVLRRGVSARGRGRELALSRARSLAGRARRGQRSARLRIAGAARLAAGAGRAPLAPARARRARSRADGRGARAPARKRAAGDRRRHRRALVPRSARRAVHARDPRGRRRWPPALRARQDARGHLSGHRRGPAPAQSPARRAGDGGALSRHR